MDSLLMANNFNISSDPFSLPLSSFDSPITFFDSFATPQWPWTIDIKPEPKWNLSPVPPHVTLSKEELEFWKYELASPHPSPHEFLFEIEPDSTKYDICYDEFMEGKLAVVQELKNRAQPSQLQSPINVLPLCISPQELLKPSTDTHPYTVLDSPVLDFWLDLTPAPHDPEVPSLPSTSRIPAGACRTPEYKRRASWSDSLEAASRLGSFDDNSKDGDYKPFQIRNRTPDIRKKLPQKQQARQPSPPVMYVEELFPEVSLTMHKKAKRKLERAEQPRSTKRQKIDPEVVCRIRGCRHIAKTRFECFKHRETHFPGRFQCPHPACRKIFVRSSSLSRHLKRPRNLDCGAYAGRQSDWGTGLINFALRAPAWLVPGFLDDITEV